MLRLLEKQTATEAEIGILFFPQVKSSAKLEAPTTCWLQEQWWWMDEKQAGGWVGCASLGVWGEMQTSRRLIQNRGEGEVQWAQLCTLHTTPAIPTEKIEAFLSPYISSSQLASQLREPSLRICVHVYLRGSNEELQHGRTICLLRYTHHLQRVVLLHKKPQAHGTDAQ